MELILYDITETYSIFFGGLFTGFILFFVFYVVYALFRVFNGIAKPNGNV